MGGCADIGRMSKLGPAPVDQTSPLAEKVTTATRTDFPTPSFKDVPKAPTDLRKPEEYKAAVAETLTQQGPLQAWVAAHPPMTTSGTEEFADAARARIPAGERDAPLPDAAAAAEAYAAQSRALATPPSPSK